jgi:hypothetical protein
MSVRPAHCGAAGPCRTRLPMAPSAVAGPASRGGVLSQSSSSYIPVRSCVNRVGAADDLTCHGMGVGSGVHPLGERMVKG